MAARIRVSRIAQIPDEIRLQRCLRLPELGPRILFFSGGTALRSISRTLKRYTHNSIHLITPFDSGGSSAKPRDAFDMLAVGDLRNRLMALADESVQGNPDIYRLFSYRLSTEASSEDLKEQLRTMVSGEHPLVASVDEPMRRLIRTHLRFFSDRMPEDFDLRMASVGNLILAGGYLANEGDIQSVIFLFSRLVEVLGAVRPVVEANCHLAAELAAGGSIFGQHKITRLKEQFAPIEKLYLVESQTSHDPIRPRVSDEVCRLLIGADLICYPIGSFYTSVIANLLPEGVGRAIIESPCPKVYVPNVGSDPEQEGMTLSDSVRAIVRHVERDVEGEVPLDQIINLILLDSLTMSSHAAEDLKQVREMGIDLVEVPLTREGDPTRHDPLRVSEALLSLA